MRNLILLSIMLSFVAQLSGQLRDFSDIPAEILKHFDRMGVDNSLTLNRYEAAYFNVVFEESRKDFDFTDKKVGFINRGRDSKADYFRSEKKRFHRGETLNYAVLHIFDASQKEESGGYDAAIRCWPKRMFSIETIVGMLKKSTEEKTKKKSKKSKK